MRQLGYRPLRLALAVSGLASSLGITELVQTYDER